VQRHRGERRVKLAEFRISPVAPRESRRVIVAAGSRYIADEP